MEDIGFKSCGVCKIVPGEEEIICSVCLEHLCDGSRNSAKYNSVCWGCIQSLGEDAIYKRDEFGRLIDPEKQKPILTCICGKRWNTVCGIDSLQGDHNHAPIPLK